MAFTDSWEFMSPSGPLHHAGHARRGAFLADTVTCMRLSSGKIFSRFSRK